MPKSSFFSSKDDKKLIELVRRHPVLYSNNPRNRKDSIAREYCWQKIAKRLNNRYDGDCKKRWKSLRDSFMRCQSKSTTPKWHLYKQLLFLKSEPSPEGIARCYSNTCDNGDTLQSEPESGNEDATENQNDTEGTIKSEFDIAEIKPDPNINQNIDEQDSDAHSDTSSSTEPLDAIKRRKLDKEFNKDIENESVDAFAEYARVVLNKLPKKHQLKAKKEMLRVLSKYVIDEEKSHIDKSEEDSNNEEC